MSMRMKFCGAAGTVTGSCYWIEHEKGAFIIDCGMFQGSKTLKELNYGDFPFPTHDADFVLLTHAHIDHSGLLPKLMCNGFDGEVYATEGTKDLLQFMLPDSGYIQEMEVGYLNRRNAQRGRKAVEPIYTSEQGAAAAGEIIAREYQRWFEPGPGVRARFWNAGHILGSASIEVEIETGEDDARIMRLLFSGDIGPDHKLFHPDPDGPSNLDYVICESTYGARERPVLKPDARRKVLADIVRKAMARDGVLVIPAFSVERTQELLADLSMLMKNGDIEERIVFLDSPLAIKATEAFQRHAGDLEDLGRNGQLFQNPAFHFTRTVDESKAINNYENGVIIIAASGMCEAGRIRHHLKRRLWNEKNTILMTGYQAPGTLGAILEAGAKAVRIQGEEIRVKAHIQSIDVYSGHVDANGLVDWMMARQPVTRGVFLTHGEEEGLNALQERLVARGFEKDRVIIPQLDDEVDLLGRKGVAMRAGPRRLGQAGVVNLDWHNDLAKLSLDIREALEDAADERARNVILRRLRRALEEE
ncbi:MBL fold metallo-hydrolase [Hyphococcus sp.]|uniref:MBL fold metallo-hydrolase n=1 Tax=Hyphococcus sp. TaxID=2038636 RepID=UPI0035C68D48